MAGELELFPIGTPTRLVGVQGDGQPRLMAMNLNATAAPTVNNGSNEGYGVGSIWRRPARGQEWRLDDPTPGAAVWTLVAHRLSTYTDVIQRILNSGGGSGVFGPVAAGTNPYSGSSASPAAQPGQYQINSRATPATANAQAYDGLGIPSGPSDSSFVVPATDNGPMRALVCTFGMPDADYGTGATGARIIAGLSFYSVGPHNQLNGPTGDAGSDINSRGIWARYDTSAGDMTWKVVVRTTADTSGITVIDTGIPFAAGLEPWTFMLIVEAAGRVRWVLRRHSTDSYATGLVTNFPTNLAMGYFGPGIKTLSAVARNIGLNSILYLQRPPAT